MKKALALLLLFLLFHSVFGPAGQKGLADLAKTVFRSCFESDAVRTVFDLEEEEAVAVFGQEGEKALFL